MKKILKSRDLDQRLAAPRDWGLSLWILMVVTPRQNVHWASKRSASQRDPPSGGCQIWEKARLRKAGWFFHVLFLISFLVFFKTIVCVPSQWTCPIHKEIVWIETKTAKLLTTFGENTLEISALSFLRIFVAMCSKEIGANPMECSTNQEPTLRTRLMANCSRRMSKILSQSKWCVYFPAKWNDISSTWISLKNGLEIPFPFQTVTFWYIKNAPFLFRPAHSLDWIFRRSQRPHRGRMFQIDRWDSNRGSLYNQPKQAALLFKREILPIFHTFAV